MACDEPWHRLIVDRYCGKCYRYLIGPDPLVGLDPERVEGCVELVLPRCRTLNDVIHAVRVRAGLSV